MSEGDKTVHVGGGGSDKLTGGSDKLTGGSFRGGGVGVGVGVVAASSSRDMFKEKDNRDREKEKATQAAVTPAYPPFASALVPYAR